MILDVDAQAGVTSTLAIDQAETAMKREHFERVHTAGCDHPAISLNGRAELLLCKRCRPAMDTIVVEVELQDGRIDRFEIENRHGAVTVEKALELGAFTEDDADVVSVTLDGAKA